MQLKHLLLWEIFPVIITLEQKDPLFINQIENKKHIIFHFISQVKHMACCNKYLLNESLCDLGIDVSSGNVRLY